MLSQKNRFVKVEYTGTYLFSGLPLECFKVNYSNMIGDQAVLELVCLN